MNDLPHLREVFDTLKRGRHLSPEDEPLFSALAANYPAYADTFAALGLKLVRHEREFFYFEPENVEKVADTLPRIAVVAYILIDHAANQGQPIEQFILGQNFLVGALPHFGLDRYRALLRQVEVEDVADLRQILNHMERYGWVQWLGEDEFRFLRPFHRVFDQCLRLVEEARAQEKPEPKPAESDAGQPGAAQPGPAPSNSPPSGAGQAG
jgi:hypothetical protein